MAKLTAKQQRFIDEYLVDLNAGAAAVRAGYSEKTAYEIGYENLRKPQIAGEIDKQLKARSNSVQWTAEEILKEIKAIALSQEEATKDRLKALELGGKHLGMFTDRLEVSGHMTIEQLLEDLD